MFPRHLLELQGLALFLVVSCVLIAHCSATDYYIDSVDGSDTNDGFSIGTPWKSHMGERTNKVVFPVLR